MLKKKLQIQKHADGDEEKTGKDIAEGENVADDRMAVLGFGDDQSGQKGPQGQGKPDQMGQPGHDETDQDGAEDEELRDAGAGDLQEDPGDDLLGSDLYEQDDADPFGEKKEQIWIPNFPPSRKAGGRRASWARP